jgi:hypothetical protein
MFENSTNNMFENSTSPNIVENSTSNNMFENSTSNNMFENVTALTESSTSTSTSTSTSLVVSTMISVNNDSSPYRKIILEDCLQYQVVLSPNASKLLGFQDSITFNMDKFNYSYYISSDNKMFMTFTEYWKMYSKGDSF